MDQFLLSPTPVTPPRRCRQPPAPLSHRQATTSQQHLSFSRDPFLLRHRSFLLHAVVQLFLAAPLRHTFVSSFSRLPFLLPTLFSLSSPPSLLLLISPLHLTFLALAIIASHVDDHLPRLLALAAAQQSRPSPGPPPFLSPRRALAQPTALCTRQCNSASVAAQQ